MEKDVGLVPLRVRQLSNLAENSRRAAFTDTSSSGVCGEQRQMIRRGDGGADRHYRIT